MFNETFCGEKRNENLFVESIFNVELFEFERSCFRQWRDQILEERDERQLNEEATDHYHRTLKRRVLFAWHNEMIQQISRDNENQIKLNQHLDVKHHQLTQSIYFRWKSITDQRLRDRILTNRADQFFQRSLLRKKFEIWKEENSFNRQNRVNSTNFLEFLSLKKLNHRIEIFQLMERQALWFDRMRLIGRVFHLWKQRWNEEQKFAQQKHQALLFWALQLQRRV